MHTKKLRILTTLALGALTLGACEMKGTNPADVKIYEPPATVCNPTGTTVCTPPSTPVGDRKFVILHTNDEHSHIMGFGPESQYPFLPKLKVVGGKNVFDDVATTLAWAQALATHADQKTVGGMVRRQYLVNKIREESADPVLLVSSGDSTMGTIMHVAGPSAAPDQVLMALLGYDFMTIGNHDFDWGPEAFASTINAARNTTFGASVPYVASNVHFGDIKAPTDSGAALKSFYGAGNSGAAIEPYAVKTLSNGLKVGFLGLLGIEANMVAVSTGKVLFSVPAGTTSCTVDADCAAEAGTVCRLGTCTAPLSPASYTAYFGALVKDAQSVIDKLRNVEKVDVVVLLSHLGSTEEQALAQATHGLDVIVGGHSHTNMPAETVGTTIIAQAQDYGRYLGQMTIVVRSNGTVALDAAGSKLNPVDSSLDVGIYGDTNLLASPPILSPTLEEALSLTGGVIAPVAAGLTDALTAGGALPALVGTGKGLWDPMILSDHAIAGPPEGGNKSVDSSLSHLSTDANYTVATVLGCLDPTNLIAVQANGVLRDELDVGLPTASGAPLASDPAGTTSASFADLFRVDPLGASPFEAPARAQPGFPMVAFKMIGVKLMIGLEVGVTTGLTNSDFFLSFSGAEVTYSKDQTRTAFDYTKLGQGQWPGGHVLTLKVGDTVIYDESRAVTKDAIGWMGAWRDSSGAVMDPRTTLFTIVTNLYIAGFLDSFGLTPDADAYGNAVTGTTSGARLAQLVMCQDPTVAIPPPCPTPRVKACVGFGAPPPWSVPEEKEWQALMTYTVLRGRDLSAMYDGTVDPPRVTAQ